MKTYQDEQYKTDCKIAEQVCKKYFYNAKHIKDDLIQSAVIKLWQKRGSFDGKSEYATFANRVAINAMLDVLRREQKHIDNDVSMFDEIMENVKLIDTLPAKRERNAIDTTVYNGVCEQINDETTRLNDKHRRIISMYMNRRTYTEIAQNVGTAKSTVHDCVLSFRRAIASKLGLEIQAS